LQKKQEGSRGPALRRASNSALLETQGDGPAHGLDPLGSVTSCEPDGDHVTPESLFSSLCLLNGVPVWRM